MTTDTGPDLTPTLNDWQKLIGECANLQAACCEIIAYANAMARWANKNLNQQDGAK